MRAIDADHLRRWILSRAFKTQLSVADIVDQIDREDTIEPDPDTVSRQAVIEAINKIFPADPMRDDYTQGITCGAALANIYVGQLPSAQPIIRCKDCKYYRCDGCFFSTAETEENGFCSWAERRTDEHID